MTNGINWRMFALCAEIDPDLFYPQEKQNSRNQAMLAKKVCESCPVRTECLQDVLEYEKHNPYRYGVWGGMTPNERRAMYPKLKLRASTTS